MKLLDERGIGTVWSICKVKFALAGHTHSSITDGTMTIYPMTNNEVNFGGSSNSATIYFGYRAKDSKPIPTSFVFGGSTGTATLTAAKFKGALEGNATTASNASTVNGHTVNANVPSNAKFTDTNTWRGIQDNLTSTSTSESLSANQGRVLKGLVDGKANSSHTHTWSQISAVPTATTTQSGIMSAADKSKLNGIASGANNYTLPVARFNTIGGIKVSPYYTGSLWPITIDIDDCAHTNIPGLNKNSQGSLSNVVLSSETKNTYYGQNGIDVEDRVNKQRINISFPTHSGALAIASDIPDVSNLCRFNFINSISECVNGRINFLFGNFDGYVDLSFLTNLEEGTILLIYNTVTGFDITDKAAVWYYNGTATGADEIAYIQRAKLVLAFFNTYTYVLKLNY